MKTSMHPMEAKTLLGKIIVTDFHSGAAAETAAEVFNAVVRRKEIPSDIETVPLPEDRVAAQHLVALRIGERRGSQD